MWKSLAILIALAMPAYGQDMILSGAGSPNKVAAAAGCAPATAFLARTSGVSVGDQTAITTFMCGLVTDNLLSNTSSGYCGSLFDLIYLFAMTVAANGANLNLCSSSFTITNHGATFTADQGYTGVDASTTIYLDTGYEPSLGGVNYVQNSAHHSVWSNTSAASGSSGGIAMGDDTGGNSNIIPRYQDLNSYYRINDASPSSGFANADGKGHYLANRTGASLSNGYRDAVAQTPASNTASTTIPSFNFFILAGNAAGTPGFGFGGQVMAATAGAGLTGPQITNLCHRLNTYLNTVAGIASGTC